MVRIHALGFILAIAVACGADRTPGGGSDAAGDSLKEADGRADAASADEREDPRGEAVDHETEPSGALTSCPPYLWESKGKPCATQLSCEAEPVTCCGKQFVTLSCYCEPGETFGCLIADPAECFPGGCQPSVCSSDDDCPEGFACALVPDTCPDCLSACLPAQPACTVEETDVVQGSCPSPRPLFPDLDMASFLPFPSIDQADPADVHPGTAVTYWEERYCFLDHDCTVLRSYGTKCGQAIDLDACSAAFDELSSAHGFAKDCQSSADCYSYLAVNRGEETFVVADEGALASFLAPIDTLAEVAYIGYASAYSWWSPDAPSGVRNVADGWEFLAQKLHNPCNPVTINGYLLHVGFDGQFTTLCQQLFQANCGACM